MLILIGTVPTAYALNRAMPASQVEQFSVNSTAAAAVIQKQGRRATASAAIRGPRVTRLRRRSARSTTAPTRRWPRW